MPKRLIAQFRPHAEGLESFFGSLESTLIDHLWCVPHMTARDCFEQLRDGGRRISYGAVKTVLDRMVHKGYLARVLIQRQVRYTAVHSREAFIDQAVRAVVLRLAVDFPEALQRALVAPVPSEQQAEDLHRISLG